MKHLYLAILTAMAAAPFATAADGLLALPLADSFADGSLASFWTAERVSGNFDWEAVAKPEDKPSPEPFDGDGGLLYYHAYRSMNGNSARLATVPIDAASATAPVIQFYLYHHPTGNDRVKVQVSADGGEWADVAGSEVTVKGVAPGWKQYVVPLSDAIPAGTSQFRVALTAVSAYGFNIVVDNVRIFNMAGKDLSVALAADGPIVAGRTSILKMTVSNNGATAVAAGDYAVTVTTPEGIAVDVPETVDVPALGMAVLPLSVTINAMHASTAESYDFAAAVTMEGDEEVANNSASLAVETAFSENPSVTGVGIEKVDGADILSWNHAIDPDYVPVALTEDFESYEEHFGGPFGGWEALDLDGKGGSDQVYNAQGSALNVGAIPQGSTWRNLVRGFEGEKMLCVTVPSGAQQDDWLISPLIEADPQSTLTLSFKIGFKNFSVSQINNFEILYTNSDAELDPARPAALLNAMFEDVRVNIPAASSGTTDPIDLEEMVFEGIPGTARRVAIHFKSKMTSYIPNAMWLDCLSLTEVCPVELLGYNVYEVKYLGSLNEAPIPAGTNSFVIPTAADGGLATRKVFVTAIYNDGEAAPSEIVEIKGAQSSLEIETSEAAAPAEYFNLQGIRVANPAPGTLLIRRAGSSVAKIVKGEE